MHQLDPTRFSLSTAVQKSEQTQHKRRRETVGVYPRGRPKEGGSNGT